MRLIIGFFVIEIFSLESAGQENMPRLKGTVDISVKKGTIVCDLTLSDIPEIDDYVIRLNTGMNVRSFSDSSGNLLIPDKDRTDSMSFGESTAWYFPTSKGRFLPASVRFRYLGMYPVYEDTSAAEDWRGNIAFNGATVRADGHQAAWYPVLYDKRKQKIFEEVKYDILVRCSDCRTLYVNGNAPVSGREARFVSTSPQQPLLFCGDYDFSGKDGAFLLNAKLNSSAEQELLNMISAYKSYYEKMLTIPYKSTISIVHTSPVAKKYGFLFVAFPSIINVSPNPLSTLFQNNAANSRRFIAHELSHYYFGHLLNTNSAFGSVIGEGFSEFLAWKATRKLQGDSLYGHILTEKMKRIESFEFIPMARITHAQDFGSREFYVYYYAPLILAAIENAIGEQQMWQWMHNLLSTPTTLSDYDFLLKTLSATIKNASLLSQLKSDFFENEKALSIAATRLFPDSTPKGK